MLRTLMMLKFMLCGSSTVTVVGLDVHYLHFRGVSHLAEHLPCFFKSWELIRNLCGSV